MNIDFNKDPNGLVPVVIQNNNTLQVLMLGYMDEAAFLKTQKEQRVTFYSRSKNRLWTKGEESGNYLTVKDIQIDCDNDTILIKATPSGPTCHTGSTSCFKEETPKGFIYELEATISQRIDDNDENSYTNQLYRRGINKVAQKVGEEAVELVIQFLFSDFLHVCFPQMSKSNAYYAKQLETISVKNNQRKIFSEV